MFDRALQHSGGMHVRIALLGGHASGKTSYLGALWASVRSAESNAAVVLASLPRNATYLNACEYALLAGESVDRTKLDHGERVELDLMLDGQSLQVTHLDVAGETYENILEQRLASPGLLAELAQSESVMLFVHPDRLRLPNSLAEAGQYAAEAAGAASNVISADGVQTGAGDVDPGEVWRKTPTAVHLVELVQLVLEHRRSANKLQVAVVVSAWDTLDSGPPWGVDLVASEWAKSHLSLLTQFLNSNGAVLAWRAFGVSAQGCSFTDAAAVEAIVAKPYGERTVVAADGYWTRDIAEPLRWCALGSPEQPA